MGKLTQASIRGALKAPGRYRDGDGLMLWVSKPGVASWVCRVQNDGKRRDFGLGSFKLVSLAEAREKAREVKKAIVRGDDPHTLWQQPPKLRRRFRDVSEEFIERKLSPASQKLARARLKNYAYPTLGKLQIQSLDADAIANTLAPIWQSKPETAKRVRQLIIRVIRFARPDGPLLETTLARGVADRLPTQPKRGRFAAMSVNELPNFMRRLENKSGVGALALQALILTAARSGEIRGARWSEIDLEARVWTVPEERMKARRVHRVPLSPEAIHIFSRAAEWRRPNCELVFPSVRDGQLSDMTLTKAVRDLGVTDATVHGFRSTFRDWAGEYTSIPGEVAEAALAHTVPNAVEAAYKRTTFFDRRRDLMDAWGRFVGTPVRDNIAFPKFGN